MRILLTGACGKIGRAIRRLGEGKYEFVLFDVSEEVLKKGGFCSSVTDFDAVMRAAEGCGAIIHTAAMHGGSYGKASNAQFIETNVIGAENLFQAALKHGIRRLVFSSTMEVLVGRGWGAYGPTVLDESLPPRPDWIYPVTKLQVEQLGSFYARVHGLEVVQLRYCTVEESFSTEGANFGLLAHQLSVEDAAQANLLAVTKADLRDETFCIGPDTPLTQKDINQALRDSPWAVLERYWPGSEPLLKQRNLTPPLQCFWPVTRIDKAKLMLGWRPQTTFETFLRTLGWSPLSPPKA